MAQETKKASGLTYDLATHTLYDEVGNVVPVTSQAPAAVPPVGPAPIPQVTVSDARTKRLLGVALNPYYR